MVRKSPYHVAPLRGLAKRPESSAHGAGAPCYGLARRPELGAYGAELHGTGSTDHSAIDSEAQSQHAEHRGDDGNSLQSSE